MGGRADFQNGTFEDKIRGARNIGDAVRKFGESSPIPIVLHLDHGRDMASVKAAIAGGYTSVMIDGSALPFEDNIELTREVVKYAHPKGVSVEGELGVLAGVEDHVFAATSTYTNPLKAVEFVRATGVDALAGLAAVAGVPVHRVLAVDRLREDLGAGRLAGAARTGKQVSMGMPTRPHLVHEGPGDVFLPDDVREDLGSPLPVQGLICFCHGTTDFPH